MTVYHTKRQMSEHDDVRVSHDDRTALPDGSSQSYYDHLIAHIQDAVVEFEMVAGQPIVRDVNPAFVDVFGYERETVVDASLNEYIVPESCRDEARGLDERTADGAINYAQVKRQTANGIKEFLYRGIPHDRDDSTFGFAVYTDITEQRRQERHRKVLNRVLRHNLRNDLNVILGALESMPDTPETAPYREQIRETAQGLTTLTAEATAIDQVLDATRVTDETVDAAPIIGGVVETHRRSAPEARIDADVPDTLPVVGTSRLGEALDAVVENAIVHNPASSPRVVVDTDRGPDWVAITVADDGPRIPESERAVVTGDADITPTRHGSGLGLWLVVWTLRSFGGELAFEESQYGGNRVRLQLRCPP
jgi:PAS domain S-box-containing protein